MKMKHLRFFFLNYTDSWSGQQERAASSGYPTEEFAVEVFLYVECENKCADKVVLGCGGWCDARMLPTRIISLLLVGLLSGLGFLAGNLLAVVALITPTATVCLISLTAKRPRGGYSEKASTHMGLLGTSCTMAASPDLMNLGLASVDLPVRLSTFSLISANLQAMWAVWQSSTGEYPFEIWPGWFNTITWAVKSATPQAGLFLESDATLPRLMSLTDTFLTLKPTLSPGTASGRDSWCISTDLTSV